MRALPEKLASDYQYTGIVCVECPGVVRVRTEGPSDELRFNCRVGHAFSSNDLIEGKEEKIEEYLWAALESMKELSALLRDLQGQDGGSEPSYAARIQHLERQGQILAQLLQSNEPVVLGSVDAIEEPASGSGDP